MKTCTRCGKPLTDPISIESGMGAVCRIKAKNMTSRNQENLFSTRASFSWRLTDKGVISIVDQDSGKSVTNDIENVLKDIEREHGSSIAGRMIMYKDSQGIWDGVSWDGTRASFFSIGEKTELKAQDKLIAIAHPGTKTLTKSEAIAAYKSGKTITHRYFSEGEWMRYENGQIVLEDGVRCTEDEFWSHRTQDFWNDGFEVVNQ